MRQFFDSNIVLYLLSQDKTRADRCEAIVEKGGVISVQVLNECVNVMLKKLEMYHSEIDEFLSVIKNICDVSPLSIDTHENALTLLNRYKFSWYDSLIVSAALENDCSILWSEDMHDGLLVNDKLTIKNPFESDQRFATKES